MDYRDAENRLLGLLGENNQAVLRNKDGEEAILTKTSIGKLLSEAAVKKTIDNGFARSQHYAAAAYIDNLFGESVKALTHSDKYGNPAVTMHRYTASLFGGNIAYMTVKESKQHKAKRIYTIELVEIGALEGKLDEVRKISCAHPHFQRSCL